jgi:hypothetical protein
MVAVVTATAATKPAAPAAARMRRRRTPRRPRATIGAGSADGGSTTSRWLMVSIRLSFVGSIMSNSYWSCLLRGARGDG